MPRLRVRMSCPCRGGADEMILIETEAGVQSMTMMKKRRLGGGNRDGASLVQQGALDNGDSSSAKQNSPSVVPRTRYVK